MTSDHRSRESHHDTIDTRGPDRDDDLELLEADIERLRAEQGDGEETVEEHERIVEDLQELHDEMRSGHDATTAREAFEQEAAQLDVSEDASEVGDET